MPNGILVLLNDTDDKGMHIYLSANGHHCVWVVSLKMELSPAGYN